MNDIFHLFCIVGIISTKLPITRSGVNECQVRPSASQALVCGPTTHKINANKRFLHFVQEVKEIISAAKTFIEKTCKTALEEV